MIKTNKPQLSPTPVESFPSSVTRSTGALLAEHTERILFEVPRVIRRIGLFVLVMTISIPVFLAGLLVVLWYFAH
jgi:hypothetical protein